MAKLELRIRSNISTVIELVPGSIGDKGCMNIGRNGVVVAGASQLPAMNLMNHIKVVTPASHFGSPHWVLGLFYFITCCDGVPEMTGCTC